MTSWLYVRRLLLTNWHTMRMVRLGFAGVAGFMSVQDANPVLAVLSALLLWQVITNTGCGARGCKV